MSDKVRSCSVELVSRYLRLISADGHEFFLDSVQMLSTVNSHHLYHLSPPFGSRQNRKDRRIAYECDTFKKMVEKADGNWNIFEPLEQLSSRDVSSCVKLCHASELKEGFKEGQTNEIQLPTITGKLLEKASETFRTLKLRHVVTICDTSSNLFTLHCCLLQLCCFHSFQGQSLLCFFEVIEYLYFKYKYTDAKACWKLLESVYSIEM